MFQSPQSQSPRSQSPLFASYRPDELDDLVGPIALYPDDLLAIVLAASTFPVQLVQAADFLDRLQDEPDLEPGPDLHRSIVALLNYPEVVDLLNTDLDWSRRLGEAVLAQQSAVIDAVADFRDRAEMAGNLRSDKHQVVARKEGRITIVPANPQVIYVPVYEPRLVVRYSSVPVYRYHRWRYPNYYYPYPAGYDLRFRFFWGVSSVFTIGWSSHRLKVHGHGARTHPYHGRRYYSHRGHYRSTFRREKGWSRPRGIVVPRHRLGATPRRKARESSRAVHRAQHPQRARRPAQHKQRRRAEQRPDQRRQQRPQQQRPQQRIEQRSGQRGRYRPTFRRDESWSRPRGIAGRRHRLDAPPRRQTRDRSRAAHRAQHPQRAQRPAQREQRRPRRGLEKQRPQQRSQQRLERRSAHRRRAG